MNHVFHGTLTIAHDKCVFNDLERYIFECASAEFNERCFQNKYIKCVKRIIGHGLIQRTGCYSDSLWQCDIKFEADCINYEIHDLIMLQISEIKQNKVICKTKIFGASCDLAQFSKFFKPSEGQCFIAMIRQIEYKKGSTISILYVPFRRLPIPMFYKINYAMESPIVSEALRLCRQRIAELMEHAGVLKLLKQYPLNAKNTLNCDKYKLTDELVIPQKQSNDNPIIFAYGGTPLQDMVYYLMPVEYKNIENLKIEACSLEYKVYQTCNFVWCYLAALKELSEQDPKMCDNYLKIH